MKKTLNIIINALGWIALFAALGSLGFASDNPQLSIPIYLIFFLIIFGLAFLYIRKNQNKHSLNSELMVWINKIVGILLLLIALFTPYIWLKSANFPFVTYLIIAVLVAILIGLTILAISLINKAQGSNFLMKIAGYLILIVIASVPAIAIVQYDSSYNALGMAYYTAVLISIFSWTGISLYLKSTS